MLLREEASERYVQRKHAKLASTGFAFAASACGECEEEEGELPPSI